MYKLKKFIKDYKHELLLYILMIAVQCITYFCSKLLIGDRELHVPIVPIIDNNIPFNKWFIIIYIGCFVWWYLGIFIVMIKNKERFYKYVMIGIIGYIVSAMIHVIYPTTLQRPHLENTSFINWVVNFIYLVDSPLNLLPSIHCFISWNTYISVRGDKKIPLYTRIFFLIFALAVFVSTLFVKQHLFLDIIVAVALVELINFVVSITKLHKVFYKKPIENERGEQ